MTNNHSNIRAKNVKASKSFKQQDLDTLIPIPAAEGEEEPPLKEELQQENEDNEVDGFGVLTTTLTTTTTTTTTRLLEEKRRCLNQLSKISHLLLAESSVEGAGWGIFARYPIPQGKMISDYLGEVVSQEEAERRGRYYDKVNRSYLFNVNSDQVVDAFRKGNKIKFANHSKRPNCEVKIQNINRQQHIVFYAKRDIEAGEELFFNYHYDQEQKSAYVKKNGVVVEWMRDGRRASAIRKRPIETQLISTTNTSANNSKASSSAAAADTGNGGGASKKKKLSKT